VNLRSFRLRIALLSTILAGTALIGFSGVAWRLIYGAKVSRLDSRLENQIRRMARPLPPTLQPSIADDLQRNLDAESTDSVAWQVLDADGKPLQQSDHWLAEFDPPAVPPFQREQRSLTPLTPRRDRPFERRRPPPNLSSHSVTRRTDQGNWRIAAASTPQGQVAIAVSLQTITQEMGAIRNIFLIAIPGTLLVVAIGAWVLSGSALHPIRQLTAVMQKLTVTGLDQRVALGQTDVEFAELIQVFNQMLERLERSFMQASRFSADAAHELKTPLAILQGELELTLQQAAPGSALQQSLSSLLDEVRRLSGIVRKLLLLSLADAGQMGVHRVQLDLSEMLVVMVEDLELVAPHLTVQTEIDHELNVWGDRDLLNQVLQNLMSNAIKYNLPDGWIRIEARQKSASVQITITNASQPMSPEERDRLFDRFYRGDPARTRTIEGIGLGLSLSREIVLAHGGNLAIAQPSGDYTTFTLILPIHLLH